MEQNFKRIADSVRLPEDSRTRIRAQIASHREKQEASIMKTKKHLPRLAVALAVLLALSLTAAAVALQKSRGFVITERMSQAEKDQLVEESSIVYARKQIDADGTVHYFNSDGSEALVLSAEEDAAYQTRLRAEHDRAVCESTALVDLSTMPVLPNAVTELAVDADGNFAGFGFENAQMVLLYPEASGGFSLQAGDTVTLSFDTEKLCSLGFGSFKDGEYAGETTVSADGFLYTFEIEADGEYCFFLENLSAGMCILSNGAVTVH